MPFDEHEMERRFTKAWSAVRIARPVHYSLFTFGESVLPYFLVCGDVQARNPASVRRGEVVVQRPLIITPETAQPELRNFFESDEEEGLAEFLLSRVAHFRHLKFDNRSGVQRSAEEPLDAAVERLNRQLDDQQEDRIAILTSPPNLAGIAVLRYAAERIWQSAPSNIQELRERGFLP
jgi:hypothetical protein